MSSLLNSLAVSRQKGGNAAEILSAYISTQPGMVLNNTAENAPTTTSKPKGSGAGDLIEPR